MESGSSGASAGRYATLDILRGCAALAVVMWHWPSLFGGQFDRTRMPLYSLLWPLYNHAELAVDLFFSLSGFIFFLLYSSSITRGKMSAFRFAVLRFSRLYPLHFATLLYVALFQAIQVGPSSLLSGSTPGYFVLHLFFASHWLPNMPFSFNGPVWSVSIEVLLYAIFYMLCRARLAHPVFLALMAATGALIVNEHLMLARGLFSFFLGGLAFRAYEICQGQSEYSWRVVIGSAAIPLGVALAVVISMYGVGGWYTRLAVWVITGMVFPVTILLLAMNEERLHFVGRWFGWVGHVSYSSYLLHGPLIASVRAVVVHFGLQIDFYSPMAIASFMTGLILLSLLCFHGFERPMQTFIRGRRPATMPPASVVVGALGTSGRAAQQDR